MELGTRQELLEKPRSKADHLRMLQDLNGSVCEVVTGVSLGESFGVRPRTVYRTGGFFFFDSSVPYSHCAGVCDEVRDTGVVWGLRCSLDWDREMDERTLVYFVDNSVEVLEAYVENGEGFDRAGGFAVQVRFRF